MRNMMLKILEFCFCVYVVYLLIFTKVSEPWFALGIAFLIYMFIANYARMCRLISSVVRRTVR
jgi:hypothetical protein